MLKNSLYYSVYDLEGEKIVCVHGYFKKEDSLDYPYREICYKGAYIPLYEFPAIGRKTLEEFLSGLETSEKPLTDDMAKRLANSYYAGEKALKMPFKDLSNSTPCGDYIDEEKEICEGAQFYVTGNLRYNDTIIKKGTTGMVLMTKAYDGKLMCLFDELEGERNVTVYCDRDMIKIA